MPKMPVKGLLELDVVLKPFEVQDSHAELIDKKACSLCKENTECLTSAARDIVTIVSMGSLKLEYTEIFFFLLLGFFFFSVQVATNGGMGV